MDVYDRVPVQEEWRRVHPERPPKPAGTIEAWEHVAAWYVYADRYGRSQSAEQIIEKGGFCYYELVDFLDMSPRTWQPR